MITLIDNIFTNDYSITGKIETGKNGIIFADISDHFPYFRFANTSIHHQIQSDNNYQKKMGKKKSFIFSNRSSKYDMGRYFSKQRSY